MLRSLRMRLIRLLAGGDAVLMNIDLRGMYARTLNGKRPLTQGCVFFPAEPYAESRGLIWVGSRFDDLRAPA